MPRGACQNALMHGRDGGVPSGLELFEPLEEARRINAVGEDHAAAGGERGQQGRRQPVNVKQRQDVQTPIAGCEREALRNVPRRSAKVGSGQGDQLRPRDRSGGMKQKRGIV